jgi:coenzyme F420-0:L-glutamate ligase / coenzyme F420-1:gamma-L-glutamate ligase
LPVDPDMSAGSIARKLKQRTGIDVGVIISDSAGRPCRFGVLGFAIGVAGFSALTDERGQPDRFGRELQATSIAVADALAAAAVHLMGEADEGAPAVLIRGARIAPGGGGALVLNRPKEADLFRNPLHVAL